MTEIWKDICEYEEYYQISNYGRVKSLLTNKILSGDENSLGYKRVVLCTPVKKRFFVHRLVAFHFCNGYSPELVVNHKDGNKQNNIATNLEWVTHSENDMHAEQTGLRRNHYIPAKPKYQIRTFDLITGNTIYIFKNRDDFSKQTGFSKSSIQNMLYRGYFGRGQNKVGIETKLFFN